MLNKGLSTETSESTFVPRTLAAASVKPASTVEHAGKTFVKIVQDSTANWWIVQKDGQLLEAQSKTVTAKGDTLYNGAPKKENKFKSVGHITKLPDGQTKTGRLGIFKYFKTIQDSEVVRYPKAAIAKFEDGGDHVMVFCPKITAGSDLMIPGQKFKLKNGIGKLNFISLMLALFSRHGIPAAHSDPLLYSAFSPRCTQVHHRCYWRHRILLHSDSVYGARSDDPWRD